MTRARRTSSTKKAQQADAATRARVMLDEEYNRRRWRALVRANSVFNRPHLDLDRRSAQDVLDPEGRLGSVQGKNVLCLGSGGGRQSIAFALLDAHVTVLDLSPEVLERDREAALQHGVQITIELGNMRELSRFREDEFDVVWQPYSINLVREIETVFHEVARVLRSGGTYYLHVANPFTFGMGTYDWNGEGYLLRRPYLDGERVEHPDESWVYDAEAAEAPVPSPQEYRHTLSTIINGLIDNGFHVEHMGEYQRPNQNLEPGSWDHFTLVAPPWFDIWSTREFDPKGH